MEKLWLLVAAAKAAGIEHVDYEGVGYDGSQGLVIVGEHGQHLNGWDPLANDDDALRLAIKLKIRMKPEADGRACVEFWNKDRWRELGNSSKECPAENMRRAIVRAAAEIGRQL